MTIRLAVDIGGTFTDVALETAGWLHASKTLTTHDAPERGVLIGTRMVLDDAGKTPGDVTQMIYGTTLATNLLIERKGAPTGMVVTRGFRDSVEMRNENRYEQYNLNIDLPEPLVPRKLRLPVTERIDVHGRVLAPLAEEELSSVARVFAQEGVESVAIGYLHSYVNPVHEQRTAEILGELLPRVELTLSSEVSPEMREYERLSTAAANAYVQPLISQHLARLVDDLAGIGIRCPLHLMLSGGGITTVDTARRFPVRLVESGPAGGAIFAASVARELGLDDVMSYDMGGTTAKICLINGGHPQTSRHFEVARMYRFMRGSGLPLRIPVIDMVEIGAGGGSIAHLDAMGRIAVGPESAGSQPGPASYALGGADATVTDADVVLGRIDPDDFAGGTMQLDLALANTALVTRVGQPLGMDATGAALGVSEIVDENMSNAARVHTVESGQRVETKTLIAFGGAAPLHAARIAQKLGIARIVIPPDAGVGSAIGFLRAPVAYEVNRSFHQRLSALDIAGTNQLLDSMRAEARPVVQAGAPGEDLIESRIAYMRYVGQGHEVGVELPIRVESPVVDERSPAEFLRAYEAEYERLYGRGIPGVDVEVLTWVLTISTTVAKPEIAADDTPSSAELVPTGSRSLVDPDTGQLIIATTFARQTLQPGQSVPGPAVIVEPNTATVVPATFKARVSGAGHLILERHE
ncbi:MAG: hydantoinase/oxoprolinase family protein [Acidimicrobiia bacterium]|nr:hydantoinase/oxoprolinase family protein [Acidimicrobiia bacterium]NNL27255.1 hydantoinase/oxoprolinase family protein [Acidimicrobiia bacterium]